MKRMKAIALAMGVVCLIGATPTVWGDGGTPPATPGGAEVYYLPGQFSAIYTKIEKINNIDVPKAYSIFVEFDWVKKEADGNPRQNHTHFIFEHERTSQDKSICDFEDSTLLYTYSKKEITDKALKALGENPDKYIVDLVDVKMDQNESRECANVHGAYVKGTFFLKLTKQR